MKSGEATLGRQGAIVRDFMVGGGLSAAANAKRSLNFEKAEQVHSNHRHSIGASSRPQQSSRNSEITRNYQIKRQ